MQDILAELDDGSSEEAIGRYKDFMDGCQRRQMLSSNRFIPDISYELDKITKCSDRAVRSQAKNIMEQIQDKKRLPPPRALFMGGVIF